MPPISLTYVRPAGDALQWLALFTAAPMPGFGVGQRVRRADRRLRRGHGHGPLPPRRLSPTPATRCAICCGAALMGVGGVMALGCTVGQAITGVSTLALGSFLTFAAIVAGGFYGLRVLERIIMAKRSFCVSPPHANARGNMIGRPDGSRARFRRRAIPHSSAATTWFRNRKPGDAEDSVPAVTKF